MENQYYTPEIEDLHVGYECESDNLEKGNFIPDIIKINTSFPAISEYYIPKKLIRTPYLTKEQIEKEGWEVIQIYPNGSLIFLKGNKEKGIELIFDEISHKISLARVGYNGLDEVYYRRNILDESINCFSINEFRKIMKLLNIK